MRRFFAMLLMVLLLFGAATFYSGPGPVGPDGPSPERWGTPLAIIGRLLTIPINTPGSADIRDLLLPLAAGAAWLWWWRKTTVMPTRSGNWLEVLGIMVLTGAILSAWRQNSLDYSIGWIVMLAAGIAWAAWLRREVSTDSVTTMLLVALACGAAACGLALWYRRQLDLLYFVWPIGALTPTAALASVAVTSAACWLLAQAAGRWFGRAAGAHKVGVGVCAITVILAGLTLWLTGRRAPLLGALAGVAAALSVLLAAMRPARRVWVSLLAVSVIGAAGLGLWLRGQMSSTQRGVSGSIAYRLVYWRESLALIGAEPLLGHGPASFARVMTPRLALRRAENPHGYHGNFDPEAHNEWLQAAVELGVPLALVYLLMPVGAIVLTARRMIRARSAPPAAVALLGGLVAIVVIEFGSTSLRHPILTPWYWTWIGLLLAAVPVTIATTPAPPRRRAGLIPLTLGATLLIAAGLDLYHTRRHAQANATLNSGLPFESVMPLIEAARGRFGFENWLAVENLQAQALDQYAETFGPRTPEAEQSVTAWKMLASRFPGMADYEVRWAHALERLGRENEAVALAEDYLQTVSPYDSAANLLIARHEPDAWSRVECVVHAIRDEALAGEKSAVLDTALADAALRERLRHHIEWLANTPQQAEPVPREVTPEWLRVLAYSRRRTGDLQGAIAAQRTAAQTYRLFYERNSPTRRREDAEWETWFTLAELLYATDPTHPAPACEAIDWAERFALLGFGHESLREHAAHPEFFGDEAVPINPPDFLRPMWRLSAKLHMATGRDRHVLLRAMYALPADRRTMAEANAEVSRIADELRADR